jgi:hypothetical protein
VLIAMASILPPNSLDGASYFGNNIGITHQYVYWCMQVLPGFKIRYVCTCMYSVLIEIFVSNLIYSTYDMYKSQPDPSQKRKRRPRKEKFTKNSTPKLNNTVTTPKPKKRSFTTLKEGNNTIPPIIAEALLVKTQ